MGTFSLTGPRLILVEYPWSSVTLPLCVLDQYHYKVTLVSPSESLSYHENVAE